MKNTFSVDPISKTVAITLTQKDGSVSHCHLDELDLPKLEKFAGTFYLLKSKGWEYAAISVKAGLPVKTVFMVHQIIMDAPDSFRIEHKDGDGLNNRRTNLRLKPLSQIP